MNDLITKVTKHLHDVVIDAVRLQPNEHALIIYDEIAPLTQIITAGYKAAVPNGEFWNFDEHTAEETIEKIRSLTAGDLVVLVQSMNFRLNEFRLRIELCLSFAHSRTAISGLH